MRPVMVSNKSLCTLGFVIPSAFWALFVCLFACRSGLIGWLVGFSKVIMFALMTL